MYQLARKFLFMLDPELAHEFSMGMMGAMNSVSAMNALSANPVSNPVELMGLTFDNPVGLAAGLDKNGDHFNALGKLGFGHVEIGTITPRPQPGNPKPRLFRVPQANAIINRMGFNNLGVKHMVKRLEQRQFDGVLGVNIGKNFDTPVENALDDYLICMDAVYSHADYITVNISSPNTPGLRSLQFGESLKNLIAGLKDRQQTLAGTHGREVPLAVKIAPDMSIEEVEQIAEVFLAHELDAVIATNTTIDHSATESYPNGSEQGGVSGAPAFTQSTKVLAAMNKQLEGKIPLIGVGGIMSAQDALQKKEAGASLVQVYTGFIYQGPELIADISKAW